MRTRALESLHPAYFAMVMATGIVGLAADGAGIAVPALVLFSVNLVAYPVLWTLFVVRAVRHPLAVRRDLASHARGVGFFTMVAATAVLGAQMHSFGWILAATTAWVASVVLWTVLVYGVFTVLTVQAVKPTLQQGLNGGWLLAVVAAQSVSVLASRLAPEHPGATDGMLFFALAMWLGGGMLYIWIIALIFYRYTFQVMSPDDLAPPYWINMGAVAISTLAGALLVRNASLYPLLDSISPFLAGLTLLFWSTATWWIPMLLTLGFWRHVVRRFPFRYDPLYWGAVFPLGMYPVCTQGIADHLGVELVRPIAKVAVWVALVAWGLVFAGLLAYLVRLLRARRSTESA